MPSSTIAVEGMLAVARKLRDAQDTGDAARSCEDVAAHGPDVTRSGTAGSGAAKAERLRAGAPLAWRVVWLALTAMIIAISTNFAHASYTLQTTLTQCPSLTSSSNSCASVRSTINACYQAYYPSYSASSCSNDPVVNGTTVLFSPSGSTTVTSIVQDDPSITCVPSPRTISPCPAGYAPKEITVQSSQQPDPYQNTFDSMPLQEMLYALCIGVSGLLGFSVGVRLS